jgi:hypothetical protein
MLPPPPAQPGNPNNPTTQPPIIRLPGNNPGGPGEGQGESL